MATGSSKVASPNTELDEDDLGALHALLYEMRSKYASFGIQLGLKESEIDDIEAKKGDPGRYLLGVLSIRLRRAKSLTWNDIYNALISKPVNESKLAKKVRAKYDSSGEHESEQEHEIRSEGSTTKKERGEGNRARVRERNLEDDGIETVISNKNVEEVESEDEEDAVLSRKGNKGRRKGGKPAHDREKQAHDKERLKGMKKLMKDESQSEPEDVVRGKSKQKKKATHGIEVSAKGYGDRDHYSDTEVCENVRKKHSKKCEVYTESESEASSDEDEMENSSFEDDTNHKGSAKRKLTKHKEAKIHPQKEYRENGKKKDAKSRDIKYSDEECTEPAQKLRKSKKVETESEEESSSASSSDEEEIEVHKSTIKSKHTKTKSVTHTKDTTHYEKGKISGKKSVSLKPKSATAKASHNPEEYKDKGRKKAVRVDENVEKSSDSSRETYHKTRSKPPRKEAEDRDGKRKVVSGKKAAVPPLERDLPSSEMAQTDSGDGESDESSEDESQKSSDEEEETEKYLSTAEENEERRSEKSRKSKEKAAHPTTEMRKTKKQDDENSRKVKEKKLSKAAGAPSKDSSHGDKEESDAGGRRDQEDQPKKRNRRRHRESNKSPIVRGGSSPSSSQEERKPGSRGKKRNKHGREHKKKSDRKKRGKGDKDGASGTSDSSPECDQSEVETKKLVSVFEHYYGQLCCVEFNPKEVAVQLQKQGLISIPVMKEMINSHESQQAKIMALIDALYEMIQSHPEHFFPCIEEMLKNEALQETAKEMLSKAATDTAAAKFSSQVSPSSLTVAVSSDVVESKRESEERVSCTAAEGSPQPVPTPGSNAGDATLSQAVSQPVPRSGLSPVLTNYKEYLQSCYDARVLASDDKYLPTLHTPYINLAMISKGCHDRGERDEFTLKTLHGGVDQILKSKSPISIKDLLSSGSCREPVRFILVEGPPGIGKSTFAWEFCRRWDEIRSLRDYHTVVLLKLREKWVLNATSLSDLFRYPSLPEFSRDVAGEVHKTHGKRLLLVLDGFDEVSHSFHEDSVIKSILCRQLLPKCTIILITRPSAKATLQSVCQPLVDKHVEIIGFPEEERVRYITAVFHKEPELQVNFLKYMFLVPHIKSMMYIPLNCAIIAKVYHESQSRQHVAIPRTRTQLYKALTHSLLVRHMKIKEGNREYTSMLPEGLNKEDMERFRGFAKFAFDSYHKGKSKKVTFFKEDIPEGLVHFGFMNESSEMYAGKGVEQTFSFLHLSLQEYLAAWHIAHSYSIEFQVKYHRLAVGGLGTTMRSMFLTDSGKNTESDLLSSLMSLRESLVEPAIFLAGITGWICQSEDGRNHWKVYFSHDTADGCDHSVLSRSLYEAQNPTILSHYFNAHSVRRMIRIGTRFYQASRTPYDCYALSYCLAHSSDQFSLSIDVSRGDGVSVVETFVKGLEDHCKPNSPPTVRYLRVEVDIDSVEVSSKCLFWLAKAKFLPTLEGIHFRTRALINSAPAHTFLQSLVNLQSLVVHVTHPTSWEWLAALKSLRELKALHVCRDCTCSVSNEGLAEVVLRHMKLPSNSAYDVRSSTDALVDSLLKSVLRSNQITKIVLPNISRETMAGVHSVLLHCPSLTTLVLKRTRLGYDGIIHICSALRNNTTLKCLVIQDADRLVPPSRQRWHYDDIIQCTSFELLYFQVRLPALTFFWN